jgi:hypothetical protein
MVLQVSMGLNLSVIFPIQIFEPTRFDKTILRQFTPVEEADATNTTANSTSTTTNNNVPTISISKDTNTDDDE